MKVRHYIILAIAILIGASVTYGFLTSTRRHTFQGSLIENPSPAPDIVLTDQESQPFRLSDQKGSVVLAFFGYTNCPDECPATLADFGKIRARLGGKADRVKFVFITTDPQRDTPAQIKRYLANFDPGIVGLTGSEPDLEKAWSGYGVYQEQAGHAGPDDYLVDHTSRVYLIDKQGNLRVTYMFGTASEAIASDVAYVLREN
jgi:protein SCO1/2